MSGGENSKKKIKLKQEFDTFSYVYNQIFIIEIPIFSMENNNWNVKRIYTVLQQPNFSFHLFHSWHLYCIAFQWLLMNHAGFMLTCNDPV